MSYIFISYSKTDRDFAQTLQNLLRKEGFGVWMDENRYEPDKKLWPQLATIIENSAAFIVVMSPKAQSSAWLKRELAHAEKHNKLIIPLLLEGIVWPNLRHLQHETLQFGINLSLAPDFVEKLQSSIPYRAAEIPPQLPESQPKKALQLHPLFLLVGAILVIIIAGMMIAPIYSDWLDAQNTQAAWSADYSTEYIRPTQIRPSRTPAPTSTRLNPTERYQATTTRAAQIADIASNAALAASGHNLATTATINPDLLCTAFVIIPTIGSVSIQFMYSQPSHDASPSHNINSGQTLILVEQIENEEGIWYAVVARNTNGILGYVPSEYLVLAKNCYEILDISPLIPAISAENNSSGNNSRTPLTEALADANQSLSSNEPWKNVYPDGFIYEFGDGINMLLVPQGCFLLLDSQQSICFDEPFWIDQTEISQGDFARLEGQSRQGGTCDTATDNLPVNCISWEEAQAFCELRGMRLPTSHEWEFAASGLSNYNYPWGNFFQPNNAVVNMGRRYRNNILSPVEILPEGRSWVGAYNMVGNVAEWVSLPNFFAMGGHFNTNLSNEMTTYAVETFSDINFTSPEIGFRCARSID